MTNNDSASPINLSKDFNELDKYLANVDGSYPTWADNNDSRKYWMQHSDTIMKNRYIGKMTDGNKKDIQSEIEEECAGNAAIDIYRSYDGCDVSGDCGLQVFYDPDNEADMERYKVHGANRYSKSLFEQKQMSSEGGKLNDVDDGLELMKYMLCDGEDKVDENGCYRECYVKSDILKYTGQPGDENRKYAVRGKCLKAYINADNQYGTAPTDEDINAGVYGEASDDGLPSCGEKGCSIDDNGQKLYFSNDGYIEVINVRKQMLQNMADAGFEKKKFYVPCSTKRLEADGDDNYCTSYGDCFASSERASADDDPTTNEETVEGGDDNEPHTTNLSSVIDDDRASAIIGDALARALLTVFDPSKYSHNPLGPDHMCPPNTSCPDAANPQIIDRCVAGVCPSEATMF